MEPNSNPVRTKNTLMNYRTLPSRKKWFRGILIVLSILYAVGTIFGGMWLGEVATHPGHRPLTLAVQNEVKRYTTENKIDFRDAHHCQ